MYQTAIKLIKKLSYQHTVINEGDKVIINFKVRGVNHTLECADSYATLSAHSNIEPVVFNSTEIMDQWFETFVNIFTDVHYNKMSTMGNLINNVDPKRISVELNLSSNILKIRIDSSMTSVSDTNIIEETILKELKEIFNQSGMYTDKKYSVELSTTSIAHTITIHNNESFTNIKIVVGNVKDEIFVDVISIFKNVVVQIM